MALRYFVSSVLTLTLAGCTTPQNPASPAPSAAADEASINKARDGFLAAFNANDATRVADLYTPDAVIMPQNQPAMTGHDAVMSYNKGLFDNFAAKLTLASDETKVFGEMAYDRGTYTMEITPKAGGATITDEGKYLVILQHQSDGSWKVSRDIDNSSKPAAPPAASGK